MPKTFYVGIKGIIIDNNKILVLKSSDKAGNAYWDLPGGRIEEGENIENTLLRELQEELPSIQNIQIHNLLGAHKLINTLSDGQGLMLLLYKVTAHLPHITLSKEHNEYKWVSKNEIESMPFNTELKYAMYRAIDK